MAADLLTVKRLHPDWNIVDIEYAPNGGIWAMGADGGIFALNAQGGTTGITAPYAGSYTGLAPEQRQGTRTFTDLVQTASGYTQISNLPGQTYTFHTGPVVPPPVPSGRKAPPVGDAPAAGTDLTGKDVFLNSLVQMGFTKDQAQSLGNNLWTKSKTKSQDALYFDLIGSTEYAARFPGMKALRDKGTAINEAQYVQLERSYRDQARSAGLPEKFYDSPEDFGKLIANGVSPDEYASRIQWGQTTALSDPTFLDELQREVPGANLGDATAFFLDPDVGTKVLEEKYIRAQYSTTAKKTGFGALSAEEKNRLQAEGTTADQAQAGFAALELQRPLTTNTAEETLTDQNFTRQEGVGYVAEAGRGGAGSIELERRRSRRSARFSGGGGAASGGEGKTGLGGG